MFNVPVIDEWMWFFKRIACFTLWQVPMISIFWKKSTKIKKINMRKDQSENYDGLTILTTDSMYEDHAKDPSTVLASLIGKTTRSNSQIDKQHSTFMSIRNAHTNYSVQGNDDDERILIINENYMHKDKPNEEQMEQRIARMSGMQRQFVLEYNSNISPERSNTVNTHTYTNYTHEKSPETVISGAIGSVKS